MLKNKSKIIVLLLAIIMLVSTISFATDNVTTQTNNTVPGDNARTPEGENNGEEGTTPTTEETPTTEGEITEEIYDGDLYLFGNNVVMDKLVDGNVFIIGQNVEVTGRVNGSLYVFANKVKFEENSYVVQSIYVGANEITLNGAATDVYASAKKIDITYNAFMIRDLRASADTINFAGGVGRNAYIEANNFKFETEAGKSAIVYGNLEYKANKELELSKELVQGEIKYSKGGFSTNIIVEILIHVIQITIFVLFIYFLISLFTPKFMEQTSKYIGKKTFISLGLGILGIVIGVILAVVLILTNIGLLAGLGVTNIVIDLISIAYAISCICISSKLNEVLKISKKYMQILILAGIAIVLGLLQYIPYLGMVIYAIFELVGVGIIILYAYSKIKKEKAKEVKE